MCIKDPLSPAKPCEEPVRLGSIAFINLLLYYATTTTHHITRPSTPTTDSNGRSPPHHLHPQAARWVLVVLQVDMASIPEQAVQG